MIVNTPVTAHTTSSQPDEPTNRAISADTMKMPEPIIEPATSMVESSKPNPLTNFSASGGWSLDAVSLIRSHLAES